MSGRDVTILVAEDDDGHAELIRMNLARAGLRNDIVRLRDGQEALDYLFPREGAAGIQPGSSYLLLLDLSMPKVPGGVVLERIKASPALRRMPVVVFTTTDDPAEIRRCHELGCNSYIAKPVEYDRFVETITNLGVFLMVAETPRLARIQDTSC